MALATRRQTITGLSTPNCQPSTINHQPSTSRPAVTAKVPTRTRTCLAALALSTTVGCAALNVGSITGLIRNSDQMPYQAVLLCRSKVLQMQDGTRSPGVVAQVFLIGGKHLSPIAAPGGRFLFTAWDASKPEQPYRSWDFPETENRRHRIDHSLGPCYAFWLPCNPSPVPVRRLVLRCTFDMGNQQIVSSPVKVILPGS